ncbi:MAG: hypothetical protein ACE5FT_04940 [Candidatus Nanoarchaeia archaeon]
MTRRDGLVKIMEFLYENHESNLCKKESLKTRLGNQAYRDLELFAMGGKDPYAESLTFGIRLTQKGVRKLFDLKRLQYQDEQERDHKRISYTLCLLTAVLAFNTIREASLSALRSPDMSTLLISLVVLIIAIPLAGVALSKL